MYIVYKHTNIINGKSYIGQTKESMNRRWCQHVADSTYENKRGHKSKFRRALRKYGSKVWTHEILDSGLNKEEADNMEIYFIEQYDTYKNGYNSTIGGYSSPISEETRMKISKANKGRKHSDEVKENMSIRNTGIGNPMYGKKQSDKAREAVRSRNINAADKTLRTWKHKSGIIEANITCQALRDKYPELWINHLNTIAKKKRNKQGRLILVSHKGWTNES